MMMMMMMMHSNLFYADQGFDHPEDVHMVTGSELLVFFYLLHPGRYFDSGRVPTLQETELDMIWGDTYSIQCCHSEKQ
jgi:hypothetical protein